MGIVGRPKTRRPAFWNNMPRYGLKNCSCGASQTNRDIYSIFAGPGQEPGFWVIKCRLCGAIVKAPTQKEAAEIWNNGPAEEFNE